MFILSNIHKLYDGKSSSEQSILHAHDLIVEDGRIRDLIPHQPEESYSENIPLVDCSGFTVTPGLIDCHAHLTFQGVTLEDADRMNSQQGPYLLQQILYRTLVDGGVTTARDIGGATHFLKRMINEGVLIGPRLKIAICILSTTGGHADFRGRDRCHGDINRLLPETHGRPSSIVDGIENCRTRIREIAACGADLIKICTSGGVMSPGDALEHREFTEEELRTIVGEAHARGLNVAAHAHSKSGIQMAIDCGVSDIQHVSFMDEDVANQAAKKNLTVTPTSWVTTQVKNLDPQQYPPEVVEKGLLAAEAHAKATQYAKQAGLKILAGTDAFFKDMQGRNYMELATLIDEGLTELEAWYAATGLAGAEIEQTDAGTLEPGQRADLLICDEDVISNPEKIGQSLLEVVKDGIGYRKGLPDIPQQDYLSLMRADFEAGKLH